MSQPSRRQQILVGAMSGLSNVLHYLQSRRLPDGKEVAEAVLAKAKGSARVLTEEEVREVVREVEAGATRV